MLKRSLARFCVTFTVIAIVLTALTYTPAKACSSYFDMNCLELNGGVGNYGYSNRYFYITSSASSYTSLIQSAVSSWVYTSQNPGVTTPISIVRTYTQSQSVFDVYYESKYPSYEGILAGTFYYIYSTCLNPNAEWPTSNWGWSTIILNSPNFGSIGAQNGLTANQNKQGTIAHEFGHAMGLAHPLSVIGGFVDYYPNRIMCQLANGRYVYTPSSGDCYVINHLYA